MTVGLALVAMAGHRPFAALVKQFYLGYSALLPRLVILHAVRGESELGIHHAYHAYHH